MSVKSSERVKGPDLEPAVCLIFLSVLDKLQDDGAVVAGVVLNTVREVNGTHTAWNISRHQTSTFLNISKWKKQEIIFLQITIKKY